MVLKQAGDRNIINPISMLMLASQITAEDIFQTFQINVHIRYTHYGIIQCFYLFSVEELRVKEFSSNYIISAHKLS